MRLLGALLAGGKSSRFGSDKALALHRGQPLIAHVADALLGQCDALVLCGRAWGGLPALTDEPAPGLGPMGGLCAALNHAESAGFDAVLASPCDLLEIPGDLAARLRPGPAVAEGQWLLGLWPAGLASGAAVRPIPGLRNVNRPADLG
jgi:molybdenum cofactor guanylyltransferase